MAKALAARGFQPDLVVGTSVGSINGAVIASRPIESSVATLVDMWGSMGGSAIFSESILRRVRNLVGQWTHIHSNEPLAELIEEWVPFRKIEEAHVRFECVAACIETSSEHWFSAGPTKEAILASCALPGIMPPVEIDGLHYIDGGVVNSIPVSRAIELGATRVFVLHVGHIDDPLQTPRHPWDVAMVSFEIARRHRFHRDVAVADESVELHILPTGRPPGRFNDLAKLNYADQRLVEQRMEVAEAAATDYLRRHLP